jgi:hypothetical protein
VLKSFLKFRLTQGKVPLHLTMRFGGIFRKVQMVVLSGMGFLLVSVGLLQNGPSKAFAQSEDSALSEKLMQKEPSAVPVQLRNPSVRRGLDLAMNRDDLKALYDAKGFGNCPRLSSPHTLMGRADRLAGADCYGRVAERFYINSDVTLRKNSKHLGRPSFAWHKTTSEEITSPVGTRVISRAATQAFGGNETIKNLVGGTIAFQFSLGATIDSFSENEKMEPRPRYVLKVAKTRRTPRSEVRVAALGDEAMALAPSLREVEFEVGERSLVEVWDEPSAPNPEASAKHPGVVQRVSRYGGRVARTLGVSSVPFSRFGFRFDRKPVGAGQTIAARVAEGNEIVYFEMTNVIGKGTWGWGAKVPYFKHGVGVRYSETAPKAITAYTYKINDDNRAEVAYDSNTRAYSALFARQL